MAQNHMLMAARYELKYIITEETALRVRDFVQQHLVLDEYGVGKPFLSYPVHSLYLDSDHWEIYWRTVNGDKNRYKLRLRYYDDRPNSPVFFEIKRRMQDVILKERCGVRRDAVQSVLAGQLPDPSQMFIPDATSTVALQRFVELMSRHNAKPKLHVAYLREAYVGNEDANDYRVTLDRQVECQFRPDGKIIASMDTPTICTKSVVILELKFAERFPNWYRDLVERFDCFQSGAAKYVEGTTIHLGQDLSARDIIRNIVL